MVVYRLVKLIIVSSLITSTVAIGVGAPAAAASNNGFDVTITDINTPVVEGETVVIEAKITNTFSGEHSEQIHLKHNGSIVDSVKNPGLMLAAGESTNVTLEWTPEYGDAGPAELKVWSDESGEVRTIDVGEGPTFPVATDSTSGPVLGGESLTVSVSVRNTGETTETTPVKMSVAEELLAQKSVELAPGETKQIDLTWETTENDTGARTVEIVSADAATEAPVRIFDSKEEVATDAATESRESASNSSEVASPEAATEATVNEGENAGIVEIPDAGIGVAVALLALLVVALLGYGLRRN